MVNYTKLRETFEVRVERRSVIGNSPFLSNNHHWVLFAQYPSMREAQDAVRRALTGRGPDRWDFARIEHRITFEKPQPSFVGQRFEVTK